ncbi:hypothetical protein Tco_1432487 [Tanacetum coccineum]
MSWSLSSCSLQLVLLWARRVVGTILCGVDNDWCQKSSEIGAFFFQGLYNSLWDSDQKESFLSRLTCCLPGVTPYLVHCNKFPTIAVPTLVSGSCLILLCCLCELSGTVQ